MPSTRLLLVAIGVAGLLCALVLGAAFDALRSSLKRPNDAGGEQRPQSPAPPVESRLQSAKQRPKRSAPARYTPQRTRLRWYSPEIAAVLLLSLAAGLWLARLVG